MIDKIEWDCYNKKDKSGVVEDKTMVISKVKAVFQNDIKDVCNVVTSLNNYQW
ncbi:MAG: hypothetical protein IJV39_00080 [Ruminococcus sp.]|nr:hypothetical protein [Ruminococcus sp.]